MAIFTGAGVAIVTPFNEDGSINYDRLDELIEFHCEHKTDSIVICGTTGESATMTEEEHMQCVKFTIDRVNKRVPVIAGTGSNCTDTASYLTKQAPYTYCYRYVEGSFRIWGRWFTFGYTLL